MKNKISLILLSLAMLMLLPLTALGVIAPHDSTMQVGCSSCHNATIISSTTVNNMCVTCHKPGANPNVTSHFYQTDPANPYGVLANYSGAGGGTTIPPSKMKSTSHNWIGDEVSPKAGALRPTDPRLNPRTMGTNLSCARCHNVHGPRQSATVSAPFLRTLNTNDEMCRDCHRSRDVSEHALGSHPINFRYTSATSKVRTNPSEYYSTPQNANPANPTSAILLVNGKIQCSSCHSTHYADSNSKTVDSRATWENLTSSRGMLLRTDSFGATSADVNICTSCHNRPNHATYNGSINIQCVDCHSGHVEYISDEDKALAASNPALYGDYAKPNVYMLRRYMNWSSGTKLSTYRKKAFLTSTSSTAVYRNDSNTTVCQACHKLPTNVAEHKTATTASQCDVCHGDLAHASQPPAVPTGCSTCHGSPPQHTVAGTITYSTVPSGGYAVYSSQNNVTKITKSYLLTSGVYKNESTAGHPTHAAGKPYSFACASCHSGNSHGDHGTQTYQDVFISKPANSPSAAYNTVTKSRSTCSNLYCHSYGMATVTKPKFAVWSGGNAGGVRGTFLNAGDNRCVKCHNGVNPTFNNMSTNSHFRHVSRVTTTGKVYTCNYCHSATVSANSTISDYAKHSNGARDLLIDGTQISGKVAGSSLSGTSCTTYCHTDGVVTSPVVTLNWTDRNTGKCDSCHRTATNTYGTPGQLASNAHFAHISSSYGPRLRTNAQCSSCHVYTDELASTHVDGTISKNSGANFCLNCHAGKTPTWIAPTRQTCQSCHSGIGTNGLENPANISWSSYNGTGVRAVYKSYSTFTNRGHGKFSSMVCSACHNSNSPHINGATSQAGTYKGARIFGNYSGFNVSKSADNLCVSCHNTGSTSISNTDRIDLTSHVVDRTPNFSYCISCHDTHGSSNGVAIKKFFNVYTGNTKLGAAVKSVTFVNMTTDLVNKTRTGLCQVCHTRTKYYRNFTSSITRVYDSSVVPYSGSWGHMSDNRKCLSCHLHKTSSYAFAPPASGGCNGCHGYPPRIGDGKSMPAASSNIHDSHRMTAKDVSDDMTGSATGMACNTCHTGHAINPVSASISVPTNVFVTGSSTYNTTSTTCSNINCHFKASPAWK